MDGEENKNGAGRGVPFGIESGSDAIRDDINKNMGADGESKQSIGMNPDSQAPDEAASNLRDAEDAAADSGFYNNGEGEGGVDEAQEIEENGGRSPLVEKNPQVAQKVYKNGAGKDEKKKGLGSFFRRGEDKDGKGEGVLNRFPKFVGGSKEKGKKKGKILKYSPLAALVLTLCGAGGMLSLMQVFQPFSVVAQFQEVFGSMHVVARRRSSKLLDLQLDSKRVKNPTKGIGSLFGTKLNIGKKQAEQLKKYGIDCEDMEIDGRKMKVLKYEKDGETRYVTAKGGETINGVTAEAFKESYQDKEFQNKFDPASKTWRGKFANWFTATTGNFLKKNKLTRNMFADFSKKREELGGDGRTALKETLGERVFKARKGGTNTREDGENESEDESGDDDVDSKHNDSNTTSDGEKKKMSKYEIAMSAHPKLTETAEQVKSIAGKVGKGLDVACGMMNLVNTISSLVRAAEMLQIIGITTGMFETVDKTKAGYGDDAPVNEFAESLNEKKETTYKLLEDTSDGGIEEKNKTVEGSAMTSAGMAAVYEGGVVDQNDPGVRAVNFSSNTERILRSVPILNKTPLPNIGAAFTNSSIAYESCLFGQALLSGASALADAALITSCVAGAIAATGEAVTLVGVVLAVPTLVATCGPKIAKDFGEAMRDAALAVIKGAVASAIAGVAADAMTRDLVTNLGGEELGNALASGGNTYLGLTHQANGGGPMSRDAAAKFAMVKQEVIAEEAEEERATLSPFDLTSKYTFLGTLMTQLMSFNMASGTLSSIVKAGGTSLSTSIVALNPKVAAATYGMLNNLPDEESYKKNCPLLSKIGGTGDAFCNPYFGSDVSTLDDDPVDVIDRMVETGDIEETSPGNFEATKKEQIEGTSDGNIKVKDGSDFSKFAKYCLGRTSEYGMVDQNIMDDIKGGSDEATSGSSSGSSGATSPSTNSAAGREARDAGTVSEKEQAKRVINEIAGLSGYNTQQIGRVSENAMAIIYSYAEGIGKVSEEENQRKTWEIMKNATYKSVKMEPSVVAKINGVYNTPATSFVAMMPKAQMQKFLDYARGQNEKSTTAGNNDNNDGSNANKSDNNNSGNAAAGAASSLAGTAGSMVVGSLPVIGDAMDLVSNAKALADFGYITGEKCVVGNKMEGENDKWDKVKYYERVAEDQSWAESVGLIDKSAITAYLEEQEEKNPIDQTYEGQLARLSGLRKETVSDTLDIIAYLNYINEYNPAERYAFGEQKLNGEELPARNFEEENVLAGEMDAKTYIVYADVRNRTTIG